MGFPSFRLEKDVLNAEIDILREMGVEFKCGVEVGKDVTIAQLREQGYKGFYLALPLRTNPGVLNKNVQQEKMFGIFQEYQSWVRSMASPPWAT